MILFPKDIFGLEGIYKLFRNAVFMIKKVFFYILMLPLFWIEKIIPKSDNIWVFGAWFGLKYSDNSKFLFEYINHNYPQIRSIWICKDKNLVLSIREKGFHAFYYLDIIGIYYALRARCAFYTHSKNSDLIHFIDASRCLLVQLWHGTPLKKIGFDDLIFSSKSSCLDRVKQFIFPFLKEVSTLAFAESSEDKTRFESAFRLNKKNIYITGYPRNDVFYKYDSHPNEKNKIIYMPTFRGSIGEYFDIFERFGFNIYKLNELMKKIDSIFYIKTHPVNKLSDSMLLKFDDCHNIEIYEKDDVYEDINSFSLLITDYSSIFFDFLLKNKPIIFAPFDIDAYMSSDREFYYRYEDVTPGPKCKNWDDVCFWIEKFSISQDYFDNKRNEIKKRFHRYQDGKNSERIYRSLFNLIHHGQ
jgi:CDP-glycerol glycerophosphotransferase